MSDISRPIDISMDGESSPRGRILYFDPDTKTSTLTAAGLRLAGYGVQIVTTQQAAEKALGKSALQSNAFGMVIVDACSRPEDAEAIVRLVDGDGEHGRELPLIVLIRRDAPRPFPAVAKHACLKRPFATPSLVRLIRHMIGDPERTLASAESTPGTAPRLTSVGGYDLIAEIARGGMGTVYLCRKSGESGFRRFYAMKILHPHLEEQQDFVTMLRDEALVASRLHHANLAAVVDLGHGSMGHYIVMEYVEGPALAQMLKRSVDRRPAELLVPIFCEILEGLHAAHVQEDETGQPLNIVHRDISPQNILVGVDGRARLADFAVAKARARLGVTRDGALKGKISYLAPEILMDDQLLDARSDIFAAGAVMWSALTGRRLFLGDSEAKTIRNILEMEVPAPSGVGLRPPQCLDEVILKALVRDPNGRYQTAQEMANALRKVGRKFDLFAPPSAIGAWVKEVFGDSLSERRAAIRLAQAAVADPASSIASETGVIRGKDSHEDDTDVVAPPLPQAPAKTRRRLMPMVFGAVGLIAVGAGVVVVSGGGGGGHEDAAPKTDVRDSEPPGASMILSGQPDPEVAGAAAAPSPSPVNAEPMDPEPEPPIDVEVESTAPPAPEPEAEVTPEVVLDAPEPAKSAPPPRKGPRKSRKKTRKRSDQTAPATAQPKAAPKQPSVEENPYR